MTVKAHIDLPAYW